MIRKFRYSSINNELLAHNKQHQFSQSFALRFYKENSIYTFIPKNACSTMRLSLALSNGCVDDVSDVRWIHKNNPTFQADLASLSSASYTFVILRCPYSRLASVYLDKIVGNKGSASNLHLSLHRRNPLNRIKLLKKINSKRRKKFLAPLSFYDFVNLLKDDYILKKDIHWRPQVDFLVYKNYDDWFCVEEFSTVVKTLKDKINVDIVDARGLTLHGINYLKKVEDISFPKLSCSTILQMKESGECPMPSSLYNDELIEIVSNIYREDIDIYKSIFKSENLMFNI